MAEATTRLAREIERVITAPYVPSLQDLYTLTNNVKPSKIKLWALQKPCQVGLLADVLVDSLSRSRVALPLLSAFATASSFRDALLYRHPATLDTFLQKATDTDESEYNAACVSMLSLPLPSDIVLPGRLASFITKLVTNMAANPSAETVTPLHSLMNLWNDGSSAFLNDISEEVMFNLQLEFTKTLRNMEDHMGILLSLATFARIVSAQQNSGIVRNQCGSETPVWLSNIQHFFGPKRGQKTLDLVALRVILACSSSSGSLSPSQAAESIRLAVSIIDTIDVSQKDAWVASGSSKIAKLCDKVLRDGFDREIQLMGITFLLSLCPIANLPSDIRNLGLRLLVSRDSRAALTTMEPHLVTRLTHSLAAYDESIVYELLRFTVDAVKDNNPNCDSLSNLHVADLLLSSFQQTEFQQVISSLLSSASTKDTIASLFDKFPSKPSPTHCEESEICYYAYATLQNKMLRNLFEMLFAATLSQSGNRREVDIIKSFVGRVPLSLETCAFATSEPSSFRSRLSLRDRRDFLSSQHPSRNWRSQVTDTLRQSSEMVHDRMMKKFEDICVDMERRCYDVEGPLRFVEEDLKKQSFEMQQLQHQNEKLRQDNRQSAQTICDLRQEVARLEEQAESTARRAEELAASLSSAQSCLQEQLSLSDGNLRMEKDKFRTRELDLIASCTEKDDRLEELQGELRCLQAEGEDLRLSLKIEVQTRESSMKTVALLQGELQEHKNLLEQQKSLFTQKEDEVEHLLGSNAEFQMETEHMKTKMDEQNRRIERLHDSLQQAEKTSRSDSEAMRQEYDSHLFSQATEIKNLQEEIAHLNRELQEAATETTKKLQAKDKRMQQLERKVQSMRDEREAKAREFSEAQQHIGRLMGVMGFSAQPAEPKSQQTRSAKNSPETTHQPDVYDDDDDLQLVESFESMSSNLDGPTPKRPRGNRTSQPELVPSRTRGVSTSKSSPQPLESTRRSSRQPLANAGANSPNKTPPTSTLKRQSTIKATDKFEENCLQDLDLDMDLEFSRDFLYTNSTLRNISLSAEVRGGGSRLALHSPGLTEDLYFENIHEYIILTFSIFSLFSSSIPRLSRINSFRHASASFTSGLLHSRILQRGRPRVPQLTRWTPSTTRIRNNSNGNAGKEEQQRDSIPNSLFWTPTRALLVSTLAAGLGYGYASNRQASQTVTKPQYGSVKDFENAVAELRAKLGEDSISTDEDDLYRHGYSEWSSLNAERLPVAISYPQTTEDVVEIAKVCHKYRMPMIPFSGGSSLEANFSAPYGGMTIDFAMMNKVLEIHENDMDVVVQPSIGWMDLNEQIKGTGLFFPVDPGPSAMIGGMVGTNCSGTNAVRYGTMKDWVINLTVVLADGRVIKTRRRPRKTSAGYNLTGLLVGSEGTLGIVTEATLKLAPIPEETRVGVVSFPTIRDCASTAQQLIRRGIQVQCMEILDDVQMDVINRAGGTGRTWSVSPTLFFKFSGTSAGVEDSINLTRELAKTNHAQAFQFAKDEREAHDLWSARKQSLWSMMALRKEGSEVWSTDVAVPISRLPDIIEISKKELDDLGIFASILGHIGDGNFHSSIMYDRNDPEEKTRVEKVVYDMVDRALEMEGSCTGEHGIGLGKKDSLRKELGEETIDIMRSLKRSLDPNWLLNPGKIFDIEK